MAEASSTDLMVADNAAPMTQDDASAKSGNGVLSSLGNGDILRQALLILALAISLAIAVMIVFWAQEPEYRPLGKMETEELIQTLDFLDQNKQFEYKLEGNVILVPEEQYQQITLQLKRSGLETEPVNGDDILLQDMGFGVSQRMERERVKHSRERQLAAAIEAFKNVSRAKVLLAIPKENVFARREKKASATVVVTLNRGRQLMQEEVDSIVDIVASAVQGLEPGRVTVSDQNGRLLKSGSEAPGDARTRKEFEQEKQRENLYQEKIDSILIPIVGIGNYTAQVDVAMDFSAREQTQKRYNPDLPALRSEQTVENNNVGNVIAGIAGALSNQPPLESNIPQQANNGEQVQQTQTPGSTHKEATRNFELDTTINHTKMQVGTIERVSVSVALDYRMGAAGADGAATYEPIAQETMNNIRRLIQGGIGFDAARGDVLEVVTIPFNKEVMAPVPELPIWEQPWFIRVIKMVLGALVIIVLVLTVVRPMLNKLIFPEADADEEDAAVGDQLADIDDKYAADTVDMLAAADNDYSYADDGSIQLPDLSREDDLLRAVRALVANEPELSTQIIRNWLGEEDG